MSRSTTFHGKGIYLALFVYAMLFFSNCSSPNSITHMTYTYHGPQGFDGNRHSGDLIQVDWNAQQASPTTNTMANSIFLKVELVGPFSSVDALLKAARENKISNSTFAKELIVASAKSIQTDNWTNKSFKSTFIVPDGLKSGDYDLSYQEVEGLNGNATKTITRADAVFQINLPTT